MRARERRDEGEGGRGEGAGGTVNVCKETCVTIGTYRCQVKDTVEIDETGIRISRGSVQHNSETKTVDINTVMKGESAYDFFIKCLKNQNQKVFVHFLEHIDRSSEEGKGLKPAEGGGLLKIARQFGKYEASKAIERRGYKVEDSNEIYTEDEKDRKIQMLEKENAEFRKILTAVRKQIPMDINASSFEPVDDSTNSEDMVEITDDFEKVHVGEKRKGKGLVGSVFGSVKRWRK